MVKEEVLEEIGLSPNESKIYLTLLELGLSTVTAISDLSKVHRANIYDSLKKLVDKGLVSHIKKDNTTYYEASNPQSLLRLVKEKETKLVSIMPQLILSKNLATAKGDASVHEGVPAFMNLLYSLLDKNEPIYIYGLPKEAPIILKTKIPHFHTERVSRKISMDHIYNHDASSRIKFLNSMPFTSAKYLPEKFESKVSTCICGDEIILTIWTREVMAVRIKNELIADSYKKHFSILFSAART
ncbi:MAG: TrmB family transcriptional regulator [Candidatus Woesearchaeota archaeon]